MGYYTFPHTRTYDSDLGWLICQTKKLLEIYDKWDQLPDMIKEILEEYIKTGEINDIIEEIIGDFILNPKYPPSPDIPKASGDGSTDDTASIQGCIDYAAEHGKLGVYFPTGAYLTGSLSLKGGVSLFGSDRYTTRIVLKSGATSPLLSGNVSNMGIHRLTLDSNEGNQVNNITTVSITAGTDIEFNDLIFASGYVNLSYLGTSGHLQLSNIIFAEAVIKHLLIAGTADVQAENLMFENLSAVSGNCCMDISTDHGSYRFTSEASTPVCIRCAGTGNRFEGFILNAVDSVVDTGSYNDYIIYGKSQTETLLGDKKLTAANITEQISGDKTVNAGDISETASNKTTHVTQDMTEQVDGTYTVNADKIKLETENPLAYLEPTSGDNYDTIPFTTINDNEYKAVIENEKFSQLINSINSMPYINVTLHGVKNDGTDTTEDIKNVINQFPQHVLFFPDGTYGISEPIKIDNDINKRVCLKLSEMATIKALDNFTGDFLVDLYYKGTESGINIGKSDLESFGIMGGFYNCNNKCSGIHIGKTHDTYVMNVNIYKCTDYGIKIDDPFDYPSADAWLFDIIIRGYADKTIGLYINSGDNNISRLRTWDTNIGIWLNRGFNTFNHIHVLCSAYGDLSQEQYEKTVGIVLNGGDCYNNVFTDCYADNFNTGIHCVKCGNNIFTRLFTLCNDETFSTKKIGILADDFYRLTINSFSFSAKQSGAVSVSVPNYSWFNTGDLTSFGYIDHRFFVEGDVARLDIYNDASMFSPFNRIYDYNIGTSGQVANTYRLIAVVRASNIPYSFKINGYSVSCDINIMLDVNNTFNLNSIKSYLDRNPTSKIAIGLIGEHFGRNLYGIYIVSTGSAYYNIKFDYLAADQLVLIPPRAIANYNDDFKDKTSITELFSQDLVNYPSEAN